MHACQLHKPAALPTHRHTRSFTSQRQAWARTAPRRASESGQCRCFLPHAVATGNSAEQARPSRNWVLRVARREVKQAHAPPLHAPPPPQRRAAGAEHRRDGHVVSGGPERRLSVALSGACALQLGASAGVHTQPTGRADFALAPPPPTTTQRWWCSPRPRWPRRCASTSTATRAASR